MPEEASWRTVAIVITTYNRRDDLRHTLLQIRQLDPQPNEFFICLDGCTDGSKEMLQSEFSEWFILENHESKGSVYSRDRAFQEVKSDFILSIDDDSYPLTSDFVAAIQPLIQSHPECGVFTFPEIRDGGSPANATMGVDSPPRYVRDYPNCAGLIRRALYRTAASYPVFFGHMYEEVDYSLQLYGGGYGVWFEPSLPFRHHVSPVQRNLIARHHKHARNELWSTLIRCPFPHLMVVALYRVLRHIAFAASNGISWCLSEPVWWLQSLRGLSTALRVRKPITWASYRAWLRLSHVSVSSAEELRGMFCWTDD